MTDGGGNKKRDVMASMYLTCRNKTMSLLLMLVILGLFINSSQALTCYLCTGTSFSSSDCSDPFVSGLTCNIGDLCKKIKYEVNGQKMIYLLSFTFRVQCVYFTYEYCSF